jgi:diaminopimelate epimerase
LDAELPEAPGSGHDFPGAGFFFRAVFTTKPIRLHVQPDPGGGDAARAAGRATMDIPFAKLHGNGNDFIVIDEYHKNVIPDGMKGQFARAYCDRRFGVGADGVIFLMRSAKDDLRMRIFQPDESEAEMCGNGIRCLAKFAFDAGYVKGTCTVETPAGSIGVATDSTDDGFSATIVMTPPQFDRKDIPATGSGEYKEHIGDYDVYAVNTGVPHAVIIVDSVDAIDVAAQAPAIRHHPSFPKGANVNFVEKTGQDSISIRTFERGVEDETLSCGTGATAAAAVMHHLGLTGDTVEVATRGGPLTITLKGTTKMQGPAETVFTGTIPF